MTATENWSTEDFDSSYTQQELSCIPQYGSNVLIDSYDLSQHKSNVSYLLIKHTFQSDTGEESVDLMALDQLTPCVRIAPLIFHHHHQRAARAQYAKNVVNR